MKLACVLGIDFHEVSWQTLSDFLMLKQYYNFQLWFSAGIGETDVVLRVFEHSPLRRSAAQRELDRHGGTLRRRVSLAIPFTLQNENLQPVCGNV